MASIGLPVKGADFRAESQRYLCSFAGGHADLHRDGIPDQADGDVANAPSQ